MCFVSHELASQQFICIQITVSLKTDIFLMIQCLCNSKYMCQIIFVDRYNLVRLLLPVLFQYFFNLLMFGIVPIVGVDRGWKVWNALSGVREERRKAAEIL